MEILGIGPLEALLILILALVFVGPRDLSKFARSLGRSLNRLYRSEAWHAISEASRNLRTLPNRLAREAALEELEQARAEVAEAGKQVQEQLRRAESELKAELPQGSPQRSGESHSGKQGEPPPADP